MRRWAPRATLILLVAVAVTAGAVALTSAPESPARNAPAFSGDHQQVTLQGAGLT